MKQGKFNKRLHGMIADIKQRSKQIIDENEDELLMIGSNLGFENDRLEIKQHIKIIRHLDNLSNQAKNNHDTDKYLRYNRICLAYLALIKIDNLDLNELKLFDEHYSTYLFGIFLLGEIRGVHISFEKDMDIYKKYFHSEVSRAGQKLRWKKFNTERKQKFAEIERIAREKCSGGYRKPHHDLAAKLHKDPEFKEIPIDKVRRIVGKVAEEFDCKSGVRKSPIS
jgi:hypothetical protein